MPIIMLINLKGGVAKTTSAVAIAECLASESPGQRTLLLDADHQSMSGELLLGEDRMVKCDRSKRTLHDLMAAMLKPTFTPDQFDKYIVRKVSNIAGGLPCLSVLPCSYRIDWFSTNMAKGRGEYQSTDDFLHILNKRRKQLKDWLEKNFDYTIIDCPPSIAIQVKFLLAVADSYIVPCIPDRMSVRGSLYLMDRLKNHNFKISPLGTLWSMYREQNPMHKKIRELVASKSEQLKALPPPFETVIPNAAKISEASESSGTPSSFSTKYTPEFAKRFKWLCAEIKQRTNASAAATAGGQAGVATRPLPKAPRAVLSSLPASS